MCILVCVVLVVALIGFGLWLCSLVDERMEGGSWW